MRLFTGKRRRWIFAGAALIVLAAGLLFALKPADPLRSDARRRWRDEAVRSVQRRLGDRTWLEAELSKLKSAAASTSRLDGWVGEELLMMKNGDWIICQNISAKEQNTAVKKDLFIGCGSDGKWYYSTFHFCVNKCVLRGDLQPDSLAQFVDGYWLAPFDGKSDESLKATWDGGQYGEDKLQSEAATHSRQ